MKWKNTSKQIDALIHNKKKVKWDLQNNSAAICLRRIHHKVFKFFISKTTFPFSASTIFGNWTSKIDFKECILSRILFLMRRKSPSCKFKKKCCDNSQNSTSLYYKRIISSRKQIISMILRY